MKLTEKEISKALKLLTGKYTKESKKLHSVLSKRST